MPRLKFFSRAALVCSGWLLAACTATAPLRGHDLPEHRLPEPGEVSPRHVQ